MEYNTPIRFRTELEISYNNYILTQKPTYISGVLMSKFILNRLAGGSNPPVPNLD